MKDRPRRPRGEVRVIGPGDLGFCGQQSPGDDGFHACGLPEGHEGPHKCGGFPACDVTWEEEG